MTNFGAEYVILQCPWKYPGQCSVAKSSDILNPQQIPPTLKPGNQLIARLFRICSTCGFKDLESYCT